jgi:hypothetical protein
VEPGCEALDESNFLNFLNFLGVRNAGSSSFDIARDQPLLLSTTPFHPEPHAGSGESGADDHDRGGPCGSWLSGYVSEHGDSG